MNKKQEVVLWIGGILLILAFILSTYEISYHSDGPLILTESSAPSILNELQPKRWHVQERHHPLSIFPKLIRYVPTVLVLTGLLFLSLQSKKKNLEVISEGCQTWKENKRSETKRNAKLSLILIIVGSLWLFVGASTANRSALYAGWFILWGVFGYEARKSQKLGGSKAWLIVELPSILILTLSFLMGVFNGFWYEHPLSFLITPIVFYVFYVRLWMKDYQIERISPDKKSC